MGTLLDINNILPVEFKLMSSDRKCEVGRPIFDGKNEDEVVAVESDAEHRVELVTMRGPHVVKAILDLLNYFLGHFRITMSQN